VENKIRLLIETVSRAFESSASIPKCRIAMLQRSKD
jgi:hypothetical protein